MNIITPKNVLPMKLRAYALSKFSATAPATMMLLGEHAVLHGYHAIVCAVNHYINVELIPRDDKLIHIDSSLGQFQTSLQALCREAPFEFVTEAICSVKASLKTGFDLSIQSDFSHQLGLGSSAAVTVATLKVLNQWNNTEADHESSSQKMDIFLRARDIIQKVQGLGSGADVAASVFGGTVAYCMNPLSIKKLKHNPPISVVYSGSKKPTREVVQYLEEKRQQNPESMDLIFKQMDSSCQEAQHCIETENWIKLGKILNTNQSYMKSLGLSNAQLDELITQLNTFPEILGAKISGSGLGDCLIGLGKLSSLYFPLNESQRRAGVRQLDI